MEEIKLEKGKWFLIKNMYLSSGNVREIFVNYISEIAINIVWKRSDGTTYYEWKEIKEFNNQYKVIEVLPESIQPIKYDVNENKIIDSIVNKLTPCTVCGGSGQVHDETSTSAKKLCPACLGNKTNFH